MTAYNVVRFRVKPGRDREFIDLHRKAKTDFKGWRNGALVKTGDQTYCFVGEWDNFNSIVAARPQMIGMLDSFRDMLEELGNGLGVTDPISGEAVLQLNSAPKAAKRAKPKAKKKAAAKAVTQTGEGQKENRQEVQEESCEAPQTVSDQSNSDRPRQRRLRIGVLLLRHAASAICAGKVTFLYRATIRCGTST